ncbi:NAD(P)/FAD-dependent oxidoreductase [Streptomyces sp. P38-E01]|uniref:NAD(P)/FAD-dependent oxidoreductase n=1 Tax=Streptomyces tardus TaxID=2780544 RepID=A0A949JB08_9ACTN|nr:NAD(P)/FAD-dependent oxidoreductase [Streptomyces tardus]MBU7596441.1 NAD(P)/FAD-dependent oxidoreductase [Streptomyces tardus]
MAARRPRIVIVGAGFAGYQCARTLLRRTRGAVEVVMINPNDYFLYLPLLPDVAGGGLEPRRVTVSLPATLPGVQLVLGEADGIDPAQRTVSYTDPEGTRGRIGYDRLVLTVGSVNKLLPIPGIAEHALGFRGIAEALYLRDHLTRQAEMAATAVSPVERQARTTAVVVGAGYTGTEVTAQGVRLTDALHRQNTALGAGPKPRWILVDIADRILPELDERLSTEADRVLRERGVEVRTGVSVKEAGPQGVRLSDGTHVPSRTLVWCVGVRPDPFVASLGLPTEKGRLCVDPLLRVPQQPEIYSCGDTAAVPDATNPGSHTAMTAQHAHRQGKLAAHNVLASLGRGRPERYSHHDLGFMVDLGGRDAAANPLHVPLSGLPAAAVTRAYHLFSQPGNRARVSADWLLDAVLPRHAVQLGLIPAGAVPLETDSPTTPPPARTRTIRRE